MTFSAQFAIRKREKERDRERKFKIFAISICLNISKTNFLVQTTRGEGGAGAKFMKYIKKFTLSPFHKVLLDKVNSRTSG